MPSVRVREMKGRKCIGTVTLVTGVDLRVRLAPVLALQPSGETTLNLSLPPFLRCETG